MKKLVYLAPIIAGFLASSLQAGEAVIPTESKNVAPMPPEIFGTGFYLGVDLGANVWQDRGDTRVFANDFGDILTVDPKNDVGFFGGIKAGWVFGTGVFRPAIEADLFYNGWRTGADFTLVSDGVTTRSNATVDINSGAFMSNFIMKFAFQRFQPYVGAGVGVYYAESAGATVTTPNATFSTGGGGNHADFAWQVLAGADYYFTPKVSTFVEYRFLEYTSCNASFSAASNRVLGQQLVGAGLRFHF